MCIYALNITLLLLSPSDLKDSLTHTNVLQGRWPLARITFSSYIDLINDKHKSRIRGVLLILYRIKCTEPRYNPVRACPLHHPMHSEREQSKGRLRMTSFVYTRLRGHMQKFKDKGIWDWIDQVGVRTRSFFMGAFYGSILVQTSSVHTSKPKRQERTGVSNIPFIDKPIQTTRFNANGESFSMRKIPFTFVPPTSASLHFYYTVAKRMGFL